MTTGYEVGYYRDVNQISRTLMETRDHLERIAVALESLVSLQEKLPFEQTERSSDDQREGKQ